MKIYKISASYVAASKTIDPFGMTVIEYQDVKETDKSYLFDGRRLSKEKLNKIEVEISSPRVFMGFAFVLEDNIEAFKNLVYQAIIQDFG